MTTILAPVALICSAFISRDWDVPFHIVAVYYQRVTASHAMRYIQLSFDCFNVRNFYRFDFYLSLATPNTLMPLTALTHVGEWYISAEYTLEVKCSYEVYTNTAANRMKRPASNAEDLSNIRISEVYHYGNKNPHRRLENSISTDSDLERLIVLDCVRLEKSRHFLTSTSSSRASATSSGEAAV